jgi:HD-GYP domain-containing protein (c-di-GMP phosphodiesterase class II)
MVAQMNGMLYFSQHRRVIEAVDETVLALDAHFEEHQELQISIREGLLIFEGTPLYDLSIYAHRLLAAIRKHDGWGLRFEPGITTQEVMSLIEVLLKAALPSAVEANGELEQRGVEHVAFEEKAVTERSMDSRRSGHDPLQSLEDQKISHEVYTGALSALEEIMMELHRHRHVSFQAANDVAEGLTHALQKNRDSFIALTAVKDYDAYTFNHSVNVCIYMASLAEILVTDVRDIVRIAQAALLHDVGKLLVPEEVLNKPGSFTPAEWELMKQHPMLGAKILMESEGGHDLAVNVAFGHHLRHDLQGYPELKGEVAVDPVTELVKVVDSYEATTAKRPYKKPFKPEHAAHYLLKGAGTEFNPFCVELFLRYFGMFPVWTQVKLDNGARGQVIRPHPDDPFHPRVLITHDPDGEPMSKREEVNTAEKDPEGQYRCTIVESIL